MENKQLRWSFGLWVGVAGLVMFAAILIAGIYHRKYREDEKFRERQRLENERSKVISETVDEAMKRARDK